VSKRAASVDDVVESIVRQADEVTVGRTAKDAGDFVNIKFKDKSVLNVRVESHPPRGKHGNVQYWERGKELYNKHVDPE
jgi:hypothetical protein